MKKTNKLLALLCAGTMVVSLFAGCDSAKSSIDPARTEISKVDLVADQAKIDENLKKELENGYSIDEPFVAVNPYGTSTLSAVVIFSTETETGVKVKVEGKTDAVDVDTSFPAAKDHIIPVYGLYAGQETKVVLTLDDGTSKELMVAAEKVTTGFEKAQVDKVDESEVAEGWIAFIEGNTGGKYAYDINGDLRWAMECSDGVCAPITRLSNGRLLVATDELDFPSYYGTGFAEVDMLGKTYKKYIVRGGVHHEAFELPNGNILCATETRDSGTVEDVVVEIDRKTGEEVKVFDVGDVLEKGEGDSLNLMSDHDWFHNNAVSYSEKTNSIILSGRAVDAVICLDYDTGDLKWVLGDPTGWKLDKKYFLKPVGDDFEYQYAQHACEYVSDNEIILFDNGCFKAKKSNEKEQIDSNKTYSRGVRYRIDEEKMTVEQVWQWGKEEGLAFYSHYISDIDLLSENNYLIDSGAVCRDTKTGKPKYAAFGFGVPNTVSKARAVQVKNDKVVFDISPEFTAYRAEMIKPYDEGEDYDMDAELEVLGGYGKDTFDETAVDVENAEDIKFELNAYDLDKYIKFRGVFKQNEGPKNAQDVKIVFYSQKDKKTLSRKIDLGSSADTTASDINIKTIVSAEGLKGVYDVYVAYDGKVFDTNLSFVR